MDAAGLMTCELRVETSSPGWHRSLIKVLKRIEGVSFTIDAERGIARVSGKIGADKLLRILAKAGKHADLLWLDSRNHFTTTSSSSSSSTHENNNTQNLHRKLPIFHSNGYGYYGNNHMPYPPPYMEGPFPYYDLPHYQPYYGPPAPNFPQAPPPISNPRLESFCNMM